LAEYVDLRERFKGLPLGFGLLKEVSAGVQG